MNSLIEAMALMAEMEGMKACNVERLASGAATAYNEAQFYEIADQIRELKKDAGNGGGECWHNWVSAENDIVKGASICTKCKTVVATEQLQGDRK